ncbi:MAG: addiction module protein [Vicinamibacterales bacterium]
MASSPLHDLLKLSPRDRADLAFALWESLSEGDRTQALELTDAQRLELDRRWAAHLADPDSAIDLSDIRRDLLA